MGRQLRQRRVVFGGNLNRGVIDMNHDPLGGGQL